MVSKVVLVLCAQALLIQSVFSQCLSRGGRVGYGGLNHGLGHSGAGCGCAGPALGISATSGGSFPVSSASTCPPIGISIYSENEYKGVLCAAGELPFVGTVRVEGDLPTAGAGAVNYGCGDGATAMESVADVTPGIGARGYGGRGYGGRSDRGCGCGVL